MNSQLMRPPGHRIGYIEGLALLTVYMMGKVFTSCPSQMIYLESTSGWITTALAAIPAGLGMAVNYYFVSRFHGLEYQRCLELTIGRVAGKAVGALLVAFAIGLNAIPLREVSGGLKTAILQETPLGVIAIVAMLVSAWSAALGPEPVGRFASLTIFPMSILLLLALFGSLRAEFSLAELFPLWGTGIGKTISGAIPCSSIYSEGFAIGVLMPHIREAAPRQGLRLALTSLLLAALALSLTIMITTAIFTAPVGAQTLYPALQIARLIVFSIFIERVEALFVFAGIILTAIKFAVGLLICSFLLAGVLGVRRWDIIVWPLAALTYFACFRPETLIDVFYLQITLFRSCGWIIAFVLPSVLLLIAHIRKVPGGRSEACHKNDR